eukprot:6214509-Pleurochrysis_carterae.AAC.9
MQKDNALRARSHWIWFSLLQHLRKVAMRKTSRKLESINTRPVTNAFAHSKNVSRSHRKSETYFHKEDTCVADKPASLAPHRKNRCCSAWNDARLYYELNRSASQNSRQTGTHVRPSNWHPRAAQ